MRNNNKYMIKDFEEEELDVWKDSSLRFYVWQLFRGETTLEKFEEDILSFRNSEYYKGSNEDYKTINDGEEFDEIPLFKGTMESLDNLIPPPIKWRETN